MDPEYLKDRMRKAGALIDGDIIIKLKRDDLVSSTYIDCDRLFPDTELMMEIGKALIQPFIGKFDVIVGPAMGGVPLAVHCAVASTQAGHTASALWAEKDGSEFTMIHRNGFAQKISDSRKRILVVEDISTTGQSPASVCDLVRSCGGTLAGVSMIWNRGGLTDETCGTPLHSIISEEIESWPAIACPYMGIHPLVTNLGHPDKFLEMYPDYPHTIEI